MVRYKESILERKMEPLFEKRETIEVKRDGSGEIGNKVEIFVGKTMVEQRETSLSSELLSSEATANEEQCSSEDSCSTQSMGWPGMKYNVLHDLHPPSSPAFEEVEKPCFNNRMLEKEGSMVSEIDMMKEKYAKLLLGEDMSGCGNGVCTALALSNAITNLCATIFGQIWRLEPLPLKKKAMWRREMDWILSVSDHIVELVPSLQKFEDGSEIEVMTSRQRSDLYINLPALRKLENMLLDILDSFDKTEFWYADQGLSTPEDDGSCSKNPLPNQEDKWWLPVPQVPDGGLSDDARKHLQYRRDCTNQILKAAMAINCNILAEMDFPEQYLEGLPKNARASLGDIIYRYINSDQFLPECLLECLDVSSDHQALDIANRVEASIYIWRRDTYSKPSNSTHRPKPRSSWEMVKDLVKDADKRGLLADRAESLLLCLKQQFPGLRQTTLDMNKIQYNKDVGKSILESYSRVLESLAFNIVARIDDLSYVDDLAKHSDQRISASVASNSEGVPLAVAVPRTPYKTAFTTPTSSKRASKGKKSQLQDNKNDPSLGSGVKKVLTEYTMNASKVDGSGYETGQVELLSSEEILAAKTRRSSHCSREDINEINDMLKD